MSTAIKEPHLWDYVTRAGGSSIVLSVPGCYPPRPLNGAMVGCFLTPDTDRDVFTYPAEASDILAAGVGDYPRRRPRASAPTTRDWLRDEIVPR